jgi:hypothetical protein
MTVTLQDDKDDRDLDVLSSEEEQEDFDLAKLQKRQLAETKERQDTTKVGTGDFLPEDKSDAFAAYKPRPPFAWDPRVQDLFAFCRQKEAQKEAKVFLEGLQEPADLELPNPVLDRAAAKHFRDAAKGSDRTRRAQALAALHLDKKLSDYQTMVKGLMKLSYESSRILASKEVSKADLLKVNSALISTVYDLNGSLVKDRRESAAFHLDRDVELAGSLPLPVGEQFLFDQAYVKAAEAELKKKKVLNTEPLPSTSAGSGSNRLEGYQRNKPYNNQRRSYNEGGNSFRNNVHNGRKPWSLKSNAVPGRGQGKLS